MKELFGTSGAEQDRSRIYDYVEANNPTAALTLDDLFSEKTARLADHPG